MYPLISLFPYFLISVFPLYFCIFPPMMNGENKGNTFWNLSAGLCWAACVGADDLLGHAFGFRLWHLWGSHPGDRGP